MMDSIGETGEERRYPAERVPVVAAASAAFSRPPPVVSRCTESYNSIKGTIPLYRLFQPEELGGLNIGQQEDRTEEASAQSANVGRSLTTADQHDSSNTPSGREQRSQMTPTSL